MGGKGVAQRVRRQRNRDAGLQRVAFDQAPEHLPRHAGAEAGDEEGLARQPGQDQLARLRQVELQPDLRLGAEGHQALASALAQHAQHGLVHAQLHGLQGHQFTHAQAAGIHQFEHRAVAPAQRCGRVGCGQQRLHLRFAEHLGHAQRLARRQQAQRGVGSEQMLAHGPAEVAPEHGQAAVGRRRAGAGVAVGHIGQQVGLHAGRQRPAQPGTVKRQVAPVSLQRQRRQAVLEPQGVDETVDRGVRVRRLSGARLSTHRNARGRFASPPGFGAADPRHRWHDDQARAPSRPALSLRS